ncbi:MAG: TRAP transporter large permease [Gracilibacteraceae bacterium]|jgi:C4-dicarboxylate transporter DctM subunit|nr:TRAP transporter large permease [Gracilibacteraceae bacterium]
MTAGSTILLISFFAGLLFNVPIAIALGISSVLSILLATNLPDVAIVQSLYGNANNFTLMAVPFFILAGNLMQSGGVSKRLINFAKLLVGSFPGGLGHVAILTSMIFAAISGSGPATVAALGLIMIPSMVQAGYDKNYAAALQAASGGIGVIIPPSIPMVVFGALTGTSIGALFAGGFVPGILIGLMLMAVNYFISVRKGYIGEKIEKTPLILLKALKEASLALLMPVIILGGIYSGVFTPTESAGVACVYGFIVGTFVYREIKLTQFKKILVDSAIMSAVCMIIMAMSAPFGWMITVENLPSRLAEIFMANFNTPIKFLIACNVLFLFLGCFMSSTAALIIITPIMMPMVLQMGINPVHFGLIMVTNLEIGMMTPPFGVNLFVACGIAETPIEKVAGKILPFVASTVVALFLITFVPWLVLIVPRLMGMPV